MTAAGIEPQKGHRQVSAVDNAVRRAICIWTGFWFAPSDPVPLGLLRILVGGMVVYSHLVWGIDLPAFLGPDGWNSAEFVHEIQRGQWTLSFWWSVPESSMHSVHWICLGILVLFWIGCITRVTSVLAFVIHVSYCQRATMATYGLDQISGVLLAYLMIGPCGAVYSVDSLLRRWWQRRKRMPDTRSRLDTDVSCSKAAGLSLRLIQFHYCVIYFAAATGKFQGESWWDGTALWRAFANYEYQSLDMTWLAWFPEVFEILTHVTIFWELSFAYLIWIRPIRPWVLAIGVLMHLGIGAFLGMWTFGLMMIFGYVAFLRPETVRKVIGVLNYRALLWRANSRIRKYA